MKKTIKDLQAEIDSLKKALASSGGAQKIVAEECKKAVHGLAAFASIGSQADRLETALQDLTIQCEAIGPLAGTIIAQYREWEIAASAGDADSAIAIAKGFRADHDALRMILSDITGSIISEMRQSLTAIVKKA